MIERELAVVPVRASDLASERLVEVAPVVKARERIEVGELPRLAEAARVLDRRPGPRRELLELLHLLLAEGLDGRAREDRQQPERRGLTRERHRDPGSDRVVLGGSLHGAVVVRHRDRAGLAPVRRSRHRLALRLLGREAESSDDRLAAGLRRQRDQCGVDVVDRTGSFQHAGEDLVEVDRSGQLAEHPGSPTLELGLLESARELANHVVHAGLELPDDLGQPLVGPRRASDDPLDEQRDDQHHQCCADRREGDSHRRSLNFCSSSIGLPVPQVPGRPGQVLTVIAFLPLGYRENVRKPS